MSTQGREAQPQPLHGIRVVGLFGRIVNDRKTRSERVGREGVWRVSASAGVLKAEPSRSWENG